MKITITKLKCKRCGYEWYPESPKVPLTCARCNSPYWNRDYVRNVKKRKP